MQHFSEAAISSSPEFLEAIQTQFLLRELSSSERDDGKFKSDSSNKLLGKPDFRGVCVRVSSAWRSSYESSELRKIVARIVRVRHRSENDRKFRRERMNFTSL